MKKEIVDFLKQKNYKVINENIDAKLRNWEQWYKGKVDGFHDYKIYQGKSPKKKERLTLNMPCRVCQDWADLLLNEKVEINCDDKHAHEVLTKLLKQVNFYVRGNNLVERAFALGGGFFIQYWDGEKTSQKYITQEYAVPLTYDSGRLTECAFASSKVIDGERYTYVEVHEKNERGNYVITNYIAQEEKKGKLNDVSADFYKTHNIEQYVDTGSPIPLFEQIRPNVANRERFDSPYGSSIYAGCTDIFKSIDLIYDCYYSEFKIGRKRIFIKDGVATFNIDDSGQQVPVFDPNDETFYSLPDTEDGDPITESNMTLRVSEFDTAIQTQLNLLSQSCGFGANGYKWDSGNISTATQVVSENSKMFRTLRKHEILLTDALVNMARGLLAVEKEYNDRSINLDTEITVNFDDSIIEDTAEMKRQALTDVNMGIISKREYFRQIYKLDDSQAKQYQKRMAKEIAEEQEQQNTEQEPEPEGGNE